jgi:hypothetical protein
MCLHAICILVTCFLLHKIVVEIEVLTLRPMQMPPRPNTRGCPAAQPKPNVTRGDDNPSTENPIAHALNRMADVMQHVTENTRREEHRPVNEGDQALERFLKFHLLQYFRKPDMAQEAETDGEHLCYVEL